MSDPSDLDHLNAQVATMRAVLVQLLQDVVRAEQKLDGSQANQLLEANEQLVVSALGAQTEAETAAGALDEAARSIGLDPLTGLPNRVLLLDRLGQAISNAKRHGHRVAVLFLDLDNFKEINDSFGHTVGDRALQMAASCMTAAVRATDTVSRHGGDEFLIVLGEIAHAFDASLIAEKLNVALREHGRIDEHRIRLSASIGISVYPEDGEDGQTLIDRADAAMYWAKKELLGGFAFHADRSPHRPGSPALSAPPTLLRPTSHELTVAEHERRHAQLREANEQLVLAALGAQQLQQAAEEAYRRRAAMLDAVAQELRNPYAPIRIAAAVLGRPQAHDELLSRAQEIIAQQMDRMSRRVANLLDPEPGIGGPNDTRATFDLSALASKVVQRCQPLIDAHRQTIDLRIPPTPIELRGDPIQIAQIVGTLVNNATTYSRPGGRILLSIERVGEAAVLTVTDHGAGIAPDALATVLDPFVRDPRSVISGEDGLGLTVVRAIVEAHGGSVVAASGGLGQGSQFTVSLPTGSRIQAKEPDMSQAIVLTAQAERVIEASASRVWVALTTPAMLKQFFFGADVVTDWKPGSPIRMTGEFKGKRYEDKGDILTVDPLRRLSFSHWSAMSGKPDTPENHHVVSFDLVPLAATTKVTLSQSNLTGGATAADLEHRADYDKNWSSVLDGLAKVLA